MTEQITGQAVNLGGLLQEAQAAVLRYELALVALHLPKPFSEYVSASALDAYRALARIEQHAAAGLVLKHQKQD